MSLTLHTPTRGRIVQLMGNPGTVGFRARTKAESGALTYCTPPDGHYDANWLLRLTRGSEVIFKATAPSTRTSGEFVGQLLEPGSQIIRISKDKITRRIRNAIEKDGQLLRISRGEKQLADFGECYIVNANTNRIEAWNCTIEGLAKELGVLGNNEVIATEVK